MKWDTLGPIQYHLSLGLPSHDVYVIYIILKKNVLLIMTTKDKHVTINEKCTELLTDLSVFIFSAKPASQRRNSLNQQRYGCSYECRN